MKEPNRTRVVLAASVLAALLAACSQDNRAAARMVAAGAPREVDSITTLSSLTIEPGASLTAPAGHDLSMTLDGVETPIAAGSYRGAIVLRVEMPSS